MFKLSEIKELVRMIDKSSIEEFELENEGTRIYLSKPKSPSIAMAAPPHPASVPYEQQVVAQAPAPVKQPDVGAPSDVHNDANAKPSEAYHEITSPMVGTFYAAPAPGSPAFVKKGDKVQESTVVCIVEAMKLMNEIEAEIKGEIVEILVENAQLVEFGQPLFLVKPDA